MFEAKISHRSSTAWECPISPRWCAGGGGAPLARPPPAQPRQLCSSVARCQSAGEHLLWPQLQQHVTTAPTTPQQQVRHLYIALALASSKLYRSTFGTICWCELWASRTVWKIIFHLSHLISILMTSTLLLLLSVGLKFRFESSPAWVLAVISLFSLYLFKTFLVWADQSTCARDMAQKCECISLNWMIPLSFFHAQFRINVVQTLKVLSPYQNS